MVHIHWASRARNQWSGSIFPPYCESFWHKLSQYGNKILYTYVCHIVYYPRKCEALHEIIDFMHEMLSVCAPLEAIVLWPPGRFFLVQLMHFLKVPIEQFLKVCPSGAHSEYIIRMDLQSIWVYTWDRFSSGRMPPCKSDLGICAC